MGPFFEFSKVGCLGHLSPLPFLGGHRFAISWGTWLDIAVISKATKTSWWRGNDEVESTIVVQYGDMKNEVWGIAQQTYNSLKCDNRSQNKSKLELDTLDVPILLFDWRAKQRKNNGVQEWW